MGKCELLPADVPGQGHLNNGSANKAYGSQELLQMQEINLCQVYRASSLLFVFTLASYSYTGVCKKILNGK